eukprot:5925691-Prymnesium_polylepis.1
MHTEMFVLANSDGKNEQYWNEHHSNGYYSSESDGDSLKNAKHQWVAEAAVQTNAVAFCDLDSTRMTYLTSPYRSREVELVLAGE